MTIPAPATANASNRWQTGFARRSISAGVVLLMAIAVATQWGDWPSPETDVLPSRVDAIVVLGGGREERPKTAVALFEQGVSDVVVVTGDDGKIVHYLRAHGVSDSHIIHEPNAESTFENAELVVPILQKRKARDVAIVTSWFHTRRAKTVFASQVPDIRFYVTSEKRPTTLSEWDRRGQRRERYAAIYYLLRYGIWP